jgi:hypothetical protein
MSMLQMIGGVAVAGAVAAGTTAFTASGLTSTITGAKVVVGGKVAQQTVVGAVLSAATFTVDSANSNYDNVTGVNLTLAGASGATLSTSSVVKATITGTASGTGATTTPAFTVTCSNSTATVWLCPLGGAVATDYYTAVSALDVTVVAA